MKEMKNKLRRLTGLGKKPSVEKALVSRLKQHPIFPRTFED